MVYCSKCGKKQKENISFCSDCGNKVKKHKVTKTETQVTETHKSNHGVEISGLTSVVVIVVLIVLFIFVYTSIDKLAQEATEARQNENTVIRAYNCLLNCPTEFLRPNCIDSNCYNGCMRSVKSIVGKAGTVKVNNAMQCMNNCHQEGPLGTCIERDSVVACSYHLV